MVMRGFDPFLMSLMVGGLACGVEAPRLGLRLL